MPQFYNAEITKGDHNETLFLAILALGFGVSAFADGHGNMLSFEQRQDSVEMTVTSVNLTQDGGSISAEGEMGEYGRVYLTYTLTADANGLSGTVIGEGRGALQDGSFASGAGTGAYTRDGTMFTMHVFFRINDGTQNLDKIVFNAFTRELTHDVFIVK